MKQTLLAFLAVTLVSLYSINQRRTLMHTQNNVYAREIETVASDLALSKLAEISALAFDEKDVGVTGLLRTTADSLTTAGSLGPEPGETLADFDDIDDYHGYQSPDVVRRLNEESFRFQMDVQVGVRRCKRSACRITYTGEAGDRPGAQRRSQRDAGGCQAPPHVDAGLACYVLGLARPALTARRLVCSIRHICFSDFR